MPATQTAARILRAASTCMLNGQTRRSVTLPARGSLASMGLTGLVRKETDKLSLRQFWMLTEAGETARLAVIPR